MDLSMRVLVVEDEVIIGEHLCSQLQDVGYQASGPLIDGAEAIEYCRSERPDIVLMDIRLGGEIDGIAAAQSISEDLQIPVVYLTAYSDEETLDRAKATHPYGYLLKPCSESHLRVTLEIAHSSYLVERGIRDSEARYRVAVEGLRDGVWVIDERGKIVFVNDALGQLLGCPPGNLTGIPLEELLAPSSRPVFRERFEQGLDGDAFELTMS
ncbi:MAG TPA: response regulator, partial [Spirochaetia bacterium]|nr:response regulator [Spirochaetia bacterium]